MADLAVTQARTAANLDRLEANLDRREANFDRLEAADVRAAARLERTEANIDRLEANLDRFAAEMRADREASRKEMTEFKSEMAQFEKRMDAFGARIDADIAAGRREQRELNQKLGEIANKQGRIVEDIVAPSLERIVSEVFDLPAADVHLMGARFKRFQSKRRDRLREFDAAVAAPGLLLINESKSDLRPEHVTKFAASLGSVRAYFPEFGAHVKIVGCVASLHIAPSLVRHASRKGLLALGVGDSLMDVLNAKGFVPKRY